MIREVIAREGSSAEAYRGFARIALHQRRLEDAEKYLSSAAEMNPEDPRIYLELGDTLYLQGKTEEAEKKMLEVLRWSGEDVSLQVEVVNFFRRIKKPAEEIALIFGRQVGKPVIPEFVSAVSERFLKEGRIAEAERIYREAISGQPDQVWPCLLKTEFLIRMHRFDEAEEMLDAAIKIAPVRPGLRRLAGELFLEIEKPERAIEMFNALVAFAPEEGINHLLLAAALRRAGYLDETEAVLRDAGSLMGEDGRWYLELGKLHMAQGREREAEKALARARADWGGRHALFDRINDPGETRNLFLDLPRIAGRMLELKRNLRNKNATLRRYFWEDGDEIPSSAPVATDREEELREQLKILGY